MNFEWPSLLKQLGLGTIVSHLPAFDQASPIFKACILTLCAHEKEEDILYLYDRLFAENLSHIKDLPQINAPLLLQAIREQYRELSHGLHDLILYLAWDRMCVCMARLFDYQSTDPKFIKGIDILKGCLIESYHHIAQQGKTVPGTYRMLEALIFYHMREENMYKHTDSEWALLSQSFRTLRTQDELVNEATSKCVCIDQSTFQIRSK